jgi:homoserine kinase type II
LWNTDDGKAMNMEKCEMDISNLWLAWQIKGPWTLSPLSGGTNNLIWRAETADGQVYVLRLARDVSDVPHMRYEGAILQALSEKDLPFLLPLPIKANSGDIIVSFEQEAGTPSVASLHPLLPGRLPDRNDHRIASNAGTALALLDSALASQPEISVPGASQRLPMVGELANCHPLVPDPLVAIERLPVNSEQRKQIHTFLVSVMESVEDLYARLPRQLLHRDYDPDNILVQDQQVTAVLDFEFAATDIRVLDLCVALNWWPLDQMGTGKEWDLIDTFGTAYTARFPLSKEELRAIPAVWRLRDAISLVHRIGRYFAGLATDSRIQSRVKHSLWREEWLSANRETFLRHVLAWA